MRKDRDEAIALRQSGNTYNEIRRRLGVPKSTLSAWFREEKWSNDIAIENARRASQGGAIRLAVLNAVKGNQLKRVYEEAHQDAFVDFQELRYHPLFIAGLMIYWAHGDKTSSSRISVSSMDPSVIRLFKMFLLKVCSINRTKAQLLIGEYVATEAEIKAYWMRNAGISEADFLKTVRTKQKKAWNKPYFGVCNLMTNSAYLKNKIFRWIELFVRDLSEGKYQNSAGIV